MIHEKQIDDRLILRKVSESSLLLICDSYNNAEKIVEIEWENFKIRHFKDSSEIVRYFYL